MRSKLSVRLGLLTVVVVASALAASWTSSGSDARVRMTFLDQWQESEVARIQQHLTGAEELLLDAGVSSLSPSQRAARARNVELLRGYRENGMFPRNLDFQTREPYFVDDRGVLCAMAYLIARSGRTDIVERVRATRNNARVRDLADDPTLVAWLDEAGLTAAEAARIQPTYGPYLPYPIVTRDPVSPEYAVASAGASLINGVAIALNFPRRGTPPSQWTGALAVLTGAAGIALGAPRIGDGGAATALGTWNVAAGTLSAMAGSYALFARSRMRRASSVQPGGAGSSLNTPDSKRGASVNITPTIGSGAGLLLNLTF